MRATINLFNSDCLPAMRKMADNQYGLAIVDVPYGIGADKMTLGNAKAKIYRGAKEWDNKAPAVGYFNELQRISQNQIIWGANNFVETFHINSRGWIVWDKGTGDNDYSDGELAWTSFDRVLKIFKKSWVGANAKDGYKRIHICQKPVALYKWLLKNYAKPGDKILDTHGGSMSIALACWDYGFDLDAYEIDKDYFEAGKKRLDIHKAQLQIEL